MEIYMYLEHVWENQKMCTSWWLQFPSSCASKFPVGCRSTMQSLSEGNLEIGVPSKVVEKSHDLCEYKRATPQRTRTSYEQKLKKKFNCYKTTSSHHCHTIEEFLGQHRLATPASQKTRVIIDATNGRLENSQITSADKTATYVLNKQTLCIGR